MPADTAKLEELEVLYDVTVNDYEKRLPDGEIQAQLKQYAGAAGRDPATLGHQSNGIYTLLVGHRAAR